jgi:LPXTG-motif cell wall-anchored protein
MDLLSSLKLPHWLMIAGAVLLATGLLGLVFTRNKQSATNPDQEPPAPRLQMPPLLSQLDSTRQKRSG